MTNPKKRTNLSLAEDLQTELNEWVQICHDENLPITRSDLIAILILRGIRQLQSDLEMVSCLNTIVQELAIEHQTYYEKYDLTLRRHDGS